jgi:hypothetical protein
MAFPGDYTYRDRIALKETMVDTANQTMDVVLPITSLSSSLQALMRSDGGDLRVTADDGTTRLAHAVIPDSSGNAYLLLIFGVWLYGAKTYIKVWSNGTDTAEAVDSTHGQHNVFTSATRAFYQFMLDPSGSLPQLVDLTSNGNDNSAISGFSSADLIAGQLSKAWNWDNNSDVVTIPDDASLRPTSLTMEMWLRINAFPGSGVENILAKTAFDGSTDHQQDYGLETQATSGGRLNFYVFTAGANYLDVQTTGLSTGQWYYVVCRYDENTSTPSVYVNATDVVDTTGGPGSGAIVTTYDARSLLIGNRPSFINGALFDLSMLRIRSDVVSDAQITTRYNIEADAAAAWDAAVYGDENTALGTTPIDVTITIPDATLGSPLSGTVTLSGSPIEGATVNVYNNTDATQATETTDASGNWSHIAKLGKNYEVTFEYIDGGTKYTATPHSYIET